MSPRPLPVFLIAFLTFTPAAFAQSAPDAKSPPPQADETELGKAMSTLNGAWRKLRRQVADPASNASSLELVATIKSASVKSAELAPDLAKDQPEADRAKFVAAYRARMQEFIAELDKLAAAKQPEVGRLVVPRRVVVRALVVALCIVARKERHVRFTHLSR